MGFAEEIKRTVLTFYRLAQERPTFSGNIAQDIRKHVPTMKVLEIRGTAKGCRLVITHEVDQHHEYEVLINPLYKESTT